MRKFWLASFVAATLISGAAVAQQPKVIVLELSEAEAQALLELMNDGVKFAGLQRAQFAGYLYVKIQKAAAATEAKPEVK